MAVTVVCPNPGELLKEIRAGISSGKIETWRMDKDGDFTHVPPQWANHAWFHPNIEDGQLTFYIIGTKSGPMSSATYAVYHGRFIEMLLSHFDRKFVRAWATALAQTRDIVKPPSL
jgi:hypothetical protein